VTGSRFVRHRYLFLLVVSLTLLVPYTQAQIAITPSSMAFGNVLVGNSQTQTVSISNVGSSSLSVSRISVSGTGYAVTGLALPYTLSPGQSVNVSMTFTPPATGVDNGTLSASASMPARKARRSGDRPARLPRLLRFSPAQASH